MKEPNLYSLFLAKESPFRVGVHFDGFEYCDGDAAITCELNTAAAGSIGFKLIYWQNSC